MELQDKPAQTLCKLGLTPLQAKTYLTLIQMGKGKIQTISRKADQDRSNTYQTIDQLQEIGLVERMVDSPNFYQAIPLHEGLSTLLQRKKDQYSEIQKEAEQLITESQANNQTDQEKEHEFKILKRGKIANEKDIIAHLRIAKTSIDYLMTIQMFLDGLVALSKYYLESAKRGVKHRVIIGEPNLVSIKDAKPFLEVPNFQIKYVPNALIPAFTIVDKKDLHISLSANRDLKEVQALTLTHQGCIEIFQIYFEMLWNQAQELRSEKSPNRKQEVAQKSNHKIVLSAGMQK